VHLGVLNNDGVFWVTRSKESLCLLVVKKLPKATDKRVLSDELVVLENKASRANYPQPMRRVRALVEVEGKEREIFDARLLAEDPETLQVIGARFGISRERVRQIETRLKRRLKEFIEASAPDVEGSGPS